MSQERFPTIRSGWVSLSADELRALATATRVSKSGKYLSKRALRVTDKRPDNFLYLGLIKAVSACRRRFVVTERDWRDIATSVYSVRLGAGQPYATSLEDIRHYIGHADELVITGKTCWCST